MLQKKINSALKRSLFLLLFVFSSLITFSNSFEQLLVSLENADHFESADEYFLNSVHHRSDIPEAPLDSPETNSTEKESEDDDTKDGDTHIHDLSLEEILNSQKKSFRHSYERNSVGSIVPLYILLHSWKSFLV